VSREPQQRAIGTSLPIALAGFRILRPEGTFEGWEGEPRAWCIDVDVDLNVRLIQNLRKVCEKVHLFLG
jgi:hypothetical protein